MTLQPERLRDHYSNFLGANPGTKKVLLTGHSHQAWPDVAKEGMLKAYADAAEFVDDKWSYAARAADSIRDVVARELGGRPEDIALGENSHELVVRFLSALPLADKPHLVTTAGEFHSMRRQLQRLAETGIEVDVVDVHPLDSLAQRLLERVHSGTSAVLASTVLFETASVVSDLREMTVGARNLGAEVLLDAYHHFGALPWTALSEHAFVTGGGYKYAQWGEGCCFLRVPAECRLRPVYTGWFSDFSSLGERQDQVRYGKTGADRFAGSTYDPVSHYRAASVIEFFEAHSMTVPALRELSLKQTRLLMDTLDFVELLTPPEDECRGGFVTVRIQDAQRVVKELRSMGVFVDARNDGLRFGPAPYTTEEEIEYGVKCLRQVLHHE